MEQEYFDEILCPFLTDAGEKCGTSLQLNQKFCSECGCRVDPSWFVKPATDTQLCTGFDEDGNVCGWHLDPTAKFCSNCGKRSKWNWF